MMCPASAPALPPLWCRHLWLCRCPHALERFSDPVQAELLTEQPQALRLLRRRLARRRLGIPGAGKALNLIGSPQVSEITMNDPDEVRTILDLPVWAVVGLSGNPARPAYDVSGWLAAHGRLHR